MKRVLIAGFKHETNTFSPLPTDLASYAARALRRGKEVPENYRGTATELGSFFDAATKYGWELIHPIAADATPSGKVTREAYETIAGEILAPIEKGPKPDAVLLSLHGAMVAEDFDDGEGELLRRVREKVGPDTPIAVTLDLHVNFTDAMARHADALVSYRTYPHTDLVETGQRAAALVDRMLRGEKLHTQVARRALLEGVDHGRTTAPGPMLETLARADAAMAANPRIADISINAGFAWADMHDTGPSAVVVSEKGFDGGLVAGELMDYVWQTRDRVTVTPFGLQEGLAAIRAALKKGGDGPVVVADFADNPGGGGLNDSVALLEGLLAIAVDEKLARAACASICDMEARDACVAAGEGASVSLKLGGKLGSGFHAPIALSGKVMRITDGRFTFSGPMGRGDRIDMGPTAVLRVGNVDIVVAGSRHQSRDPGFFTHAGIVPEQQQLLMVKSMQHFRAAFAPMAREIVVVDSGDGLTSHKLKSLPFRKLRRPIYPLDPV